LGVLLSVGDTDGARKAMFAKRLAGVQLRVRNFFFSTVTTLHATLGSKPPRAT
jgi:hypothetical protein